MGTHMLEQINNFYCKDKTSQMNSDERPRSFWELVPLVTFMFLIIPVAPFR